MAIWTQTRQTNQLEGKKFATESDEHTPKHIANRHLLRQAASQPVAWMHQTHVEFHIVANKMKSKNNQTKHAHTQYQKKLTKTSNLSELLYICFVHVEFPLAGIGAVACYACCFSDTRTAVCRYFFLLIHFTHFAYYLYTRSCMSVFFGNFVNEILLFYRRMVCGADFQLQFPHRLQCSTKFQCEINNNHCIHTQKKQKNQENNVCLHFKMQEKRVTAVAAFTSICIMKGVGRQSTVWCAQEKKTKTLISFFLSFHLASASEIVLTNYDYHLRTATISLCALLRRKIPFLIPKFKRAHLQWNFFQLTFKLIRLQWRSVFRLLPLKLLFPHPYHFVKIDCALVFLCRQRLFSVLIWKLKFLLHHFKCFYDILRRYCLLCVCILV